MEEKEKRSSGDTDVVMVVVMVIVKVGVLVVVRYHSVTLWTSSMAIEIHRMRANSIQNSNASLSLKFSGDMK
jgi:hypothetical protein